MYRTPSAKSVRNISITGTRPSTNDRRYNTCGTSSRDIYVPFHNINICSTLLNKREFNRVKTASQFHPKEERQRQLQKFEDEQRRLQEESNKRKNFLQYIDQIRNGSDKTSSDHFDMKDPIEDEKILSRVFWTKHEQEDEVKRANRIILAKKVHMVQDAQINEKRELEREWRDTQLRLEKEMLEKDKKAVEQQKIVEESKKKLKERYANELRTALEYHESKKFIEAQRIENEAEAMQKAKIALKTDEEAKEREKREQIERVRRDFEETKKITEHYRLLAAESKRVAEMKAQEYMRFKAEQQRQLEKEKQLECERRQREIDRILVRQTQLLRTKQQNDAASMRRIQEEKERQYRQRIIEAARKQRQMLKDIGVARSKQIEESKRIREREEQLEAKERQKLIEQIRDFEEKQKIEKEKNHKIKENYRKEILGQIALKEEQKSNKKVLATIESDEQRKEEEKRQRNIRRVLEAKVKAMRDSKIPEHLVRDVERQLNLNVN